MLSHCKSLLFFVLLISVCFGSPLSTNWERCQSNMNLALPFVWKKVVATIWRCLTSVGFGIKNVFFPFLFSNNQILFIPLYPLFYLYPYTPFPGIIQFHFPCSPKCVSVKHLSISIPVIYLWNSFTLFMQAQAHMIISITISWVKICCTHIHDTHFNVMLQPIHLHAIQYSQEISP